MVYHMARKERKASVWLEHCRLRHKLEQESPPASDFWCVTHRWAAHHCVGGSNPNACERSLASHAVYTLIQCTPLLVEKAGVAPVVTFRITARKQESMQARYPLWIWNPWGRTHEVQNRSNQWLHKMDLGPNKNLKKKKKKKSPPAWLQEAYHPQHAGPD